MNSLINQKPLKKREEKSPELHFGGSQSPKPVSVLFIFHGLRKENESSLQVKRGLLLLQPFKLLGDSLLLSLFGLTVCLTLRNISEMP